MFYILRSTPDSVYLIVTIVEYSDNKQIDFFCLFSLSLSLPCAKLSHCDCQFRGFLFDIECERIASQSFRRRERDFSVLSIRHVHDIYPVPNRQKGSECEAKQRNTFMGRYSWRQSSHKSRHIRMNTTHLVYRNRSCVLCVRRVCVIVVALFFFVFRFEEFIPQLMDMNWTLIYFTV